MVRYPVVLLPDDNGTVLVTFPDFPEAQTFGDSREEALAYASDALATIVDGYVRARRPLPAPSEIHGDAAELSALMSAKVELYNAMQALGVTKSDLGRRLNWHLPQVDRLLDLNHASQVDQLDAAVRALGGRLTVKVDGIVAQVKPRMIIGRKKFAFAAAVTTHASGGRKRPAPHSHKVGAGRGRAKGTIGKKK
jgi:antitoxin HicB